MHIRFERTKESTAAHFALLSATVIIAQQVAGKATRDSLFLSYFAVTDLPKVVIAGGILSIFGVLLMSRLLARFGPALLVPAAFGISATLHICEWFLFGIAPEIATLVLYFHIAVFGAVLISGFWSLVNERFDPHTAKKTIAQVAAAATLGGILGGLVAERVASIMAIQAMLLVLAGMHAVCSFSVSRVGGTSDQHVESTAPPGFTLGLRILHKTAYLKQMALLMTLTAGIAALLDYALKAEAAQRFESGESLITFFAIFYAAAGVLSFLIQSTLGRNALKQLGLGKTLAVLPASIVLVGLISTLMTNIWTIVFMRGVQAVLTHSLHRSGFELLYAPLALDQKRPTKSIIDVGSDRLGDILGGGLVLLLITVLVEVPTALIAGIAVVAAALTLFVVFRLHHGYIEQLALSLRSRPLTALGLPKNIPSARPTQPQPNAPVGITKTSTDLSKRSKEIAEPVKRPKPETPPKESMPAVTERISDSIIAAVGELRSHNTGRIQRILNRDQFDPILTPHVIPLLAHTELARDATKTLTRIASSIVGQLVDTMLNMNNSLVVRARLPRVLESCVSSRAVDGLLLGLATEPFEIRFRCGQSLTRIISNNEFLSVSRKTIFTVVQRELDVDENVWKSRNLSIAKATPHSSQKQSPDYGLEHVFTLLGLILDREAIQLSLHAITRGDTNLRGTALEYLENVLPERVCASLWRYVRGPVAIKKTTRSNTEIVNDLLRSARSILGDRSKLVEYPVRMEGRYTIISLIGELDLNVSPLARQQILKYLDKKNNVMVDMSAVDYIDSSAIASLVEGLQHAKKQKLDFGLLGVTQATMRVLQLTRLDKVFPIYASMEALK